MRLFVDFHVDVACNTNAYDVCEIKLLNYLRFRSFNYVDGDACTVYKPIEFDILHNIQYLSLMAGNTVCIN